jgi:predicted N-formylglutamate amidohydrolase
MAEAWTYISGRQETGVLIVADHASNHVPPDIDLDIEPELLTKHIAADLGVAALSSALNARLGIPAILGGVSRLVIDLNREEDAPHIIPSTSDGYSIPGNAISDDARNVRFDRFWKSYHDEVARLITNTRPVLLVSLHSFTPQLETAPSSERPWQVGILYNDDDRAARIALPLLASAGVNVGDQLPYSGKLLNATMNLHGERNGIAYLGVEMRQDLIANAEGVAHWAGVLGAVITACRDKVKQ